MADETTTTTATTQETTADTTQQTTTTSETTEKTFTQADVDRIIADRLAREKKGIPSKEELKAFKDWQDNQKTAEQKHADEIKNAQDAKTAAEQRAADYEAKYTAMSKGVSAVAVEDVIALARVKVSDTVTLEQAIDAVIVKYPQFGGTSDKPNITTGVPSGGGAQPTGVEAAFLARNPGLKI